MTAKHLCAVIFALTVFLPNANAQTPTDKARLSRTMWAAFQCGTFAEMSGDEKEQARLFELGVRAGREFMDALKNRQIPPDVANNEVPIGVSMLLGGPTPDFAIGRIFENAMRDAYDEVVKKPGGLPTDPQWIDDKELRKMKAKTKYLASNCALVK